MTRYVFIESRDPYESRDVRFVKETATALAKLGHEVTVFFVQNGVFASRNGARDSYISRLAQAGITLLADDFSLVERGIQTAEIHPDVRPSGIETLVDLLVQENTKAIWH